MLSRLGKQLIKIGQYTFSCRGTNGPKSNWRCSCHHNKGCKAVLRTVDQEIVSIKNEHNH